MRPRRRAGPFSCASGGNSGRLSKVEMGGLNTKTHLAAVALTAALVQPASAVTFPSLTTIHVGTGVSDSGSAFELGDATVFQCSNVSGFTANIRILLLHENGALAGQRTETVLHGQSLGTATPQHSLLFRE
jgi:hypothetical protein